MTSFEIVALSKEIHQSKSVASILVEDINRQNLKLAQSREDQQKNKSLSSNLQQEYKSAGLDKNCVLLEFNQLLNQIQKLQKESDSMDEIHKKRLFQKEANLKHLMKINAWHSKEAERLDSQNMQILRDIQRHNWHETRLELMHLNKIAQKEKQKVEAMVENALIESYAKSSSKEFNKPEIQIPNFAEKANSGMSFSSLPREMDSPELPATRALSAQPSKIWLPPARDS